MSGINGSPSTPPVWVGNTGVAGYNTVNHLALTQWLPGIIKADMWIFLTGGNDLQASLAFEGAPTQAFLEQQAQFGGDLPAGTLWRTQRPEYPRFRRSELFRQIRRTFDGIVQLVHPPSTSIRVDIVALRKRRANGPIVTLPDLSTGVNEYRARLLSLADRCRNLKQRCLFLTQPSIWRADLSPAEQRLLWSGYAGRRANPRGYISSGDLSKALDMYNTALLDVCLRNNLECFDLASKIPKDTSAFYDDIHLNENGARLVAGTLQQYLLAHPPFSSSSQ